MLGERLNSSFASAREHFLLLASQSRCLYSPAAISISGHGVPEFPEPACRLRSVEARLFSAAVDELQGRPTSFLTDPRARARPSVTA